MKKFVKLLSLGLIAGSLFGCSCIKEEVFEYVAERSNLTFTSNKVTTSLTTQDVYEYIRENEEESVNKYFLKYLMKQVLDLENNTTNKSMYDLKVKKHFEETILTSQEYMVNGVFVEDLFATDLETQLYVVDKENKPTSGVTYELGLKYDYSDYIERALEYDVLLEILKGKYIIEVKPAIIDDSKTRVISIYTESNLSSMIELVDDLVAGKYESFDALTEAKKTEEITELGRQYCQELGFTNSYYTPKEGEGDCSPTTNNTTYDTTLNKFTVCENGVKCSPDKGLEYQVSLVREKDYLVEQVVNKNTTGILYEAALQQLFKDNVEDYLHEIIEGEDYFLADWLYNNSKEFSNRDIILTTGPDSTCYLVTVRVVDSQTQDIEDKEAALSLLLGKVSDTTVLNHYFGDLNIEVKEPTLKEYFNSLLGKK